MRFLPGLTALLPQLVALDGQDLSVKRMLSFMTLMPGEVATCIGCHESRTVAPPDQPGLVALQRPPSPITRIPEAPEIFDYCRDIQPIWDRHCVRCHDTVQYAGRALLTGDLGPMFTHSYFTLSARLQIADGRDFAPGNYAPYTIGSAASPLMDKLTCAHHDVSLTRAELRVVKLWIEASATFPGTYAALGGGMIGPYAALQYGTKPAIDYLAWPGLKAAREVMSRRCASCHTGPRRLPESPADDLEFRLHHLEYGGGKPRYWVPPWVAPAGEGAPGFHQAVRHARLPPGAGIRPRDEALRHPAGEPSARRPHRRVCHGPALLGIPVAPARGPAHGPGRAELRSPATRAGDALRSAARRRRLTSSRARLSRNRAPRLPAVGEERRMARSS